MLPGAVKLAKGVVFKGTVTVKNTSGAEKVCLAREQKGQLVAKPVQRLRLVRSWRLAYMKTRRRFTQLVLTTGNVF